MARNSLRLFAALAFLCSLAAPFSPTMTLPANSLRLGRQTMIQKRSFGLVSGHMNGVGARESRRTRDVALFSEPNGGWDSPSGLAPGSTMSGGTGLNNAGEPPFELRGFSLGNLVIGGGFLVTILSFVDYLGGSTGSAVSGLGFVYGIPIILAGSALKYAEIDPVPSYVGPNAEGLFDAKATETLVKIKKDVTRHRYGDEAHLDTTVKRLGLVLTGKAYPQLRELREENVNGELSFSMVWQSLDTPYKMWSDPKRVKKYETFFGPGVTAECVKISKEEKLVAIRLTTTGERESKQVVGGGGSAAE